METNSSGNKKFTAKGGGFIFVGLLFLGMAGGYLTGNMRAGIFIGMGLGFLVMGLLALLKK